MTDMYHGDPEAAARADATDRAIDAEDAAGKPETVDPAPVNAPPDHGIRLVDHARAELERLGEFTPGVGDPAYAQSLVAAIAAYTSYPHSGFSHEHGHDLLIRLLGRENLTPLTWDPREWIDRTSISGVPEGETLWQSSRNAKAFSADQAETYWLAGDDHGHDLTYYRTVAPGIPPFRQDPNPLPWPIGEDQPCSRMTKGGAVVMTFNAALELIRTGDRVTRRAWITQEGFPFLFLVPGSTFTVEAERPMGKAAPELVGKTIAYQPHIDVCYPDHRVGPWYPHQEAILAEDWVSVD